MRDGGIKCDLPQFPSSSSYINRFLPFARVGVMHNKPVSIFVLYSEESLVPDTCAITFAFHRVSPCFSFPPKARRIIPPAWIARSGQSLRDVIGAISSRRNAPAMTLRVTNMEARSSKRQHGSPCGEMGGAIRYPSLSAAESRWWSDCDLLRALFTPPGKRRRTVQFTRVS